MKGPRIDQKFCVSTITDLERRQEEPLVHTNPQNVQMEQNRHLPQDPVRLRGHTDTAGAQAPAIPPSPPCSGAKSSTAFGEEWRKGMGKGDQLTVIPPTLPNPCGNFSRHRDGGAGRRTMGRSPRGCVSSPRGWVTSRCGTQPCLESAKPWDQPGAAHMESTVTTGDKQRRDRS